MADYKKKDNDALYRLLVHQLDNAKTREERADILKEIAKVRFSPNKEEPKADTYTKIDRITMSEPNVSNVFVEKHEPIAPSEILKEKPAKKGLWQKLKDMFKV